MENNDIELLNTTGFVSKGVGEGRRSIKMRPSASRRIKSRGKGRSFGGTGFVLRLCVCAVLLCCVIAVKLRGDEDSLAVIGALTSENETETEEESPLGRLKFVELPSIIEVFAPSEKFVLPIEKAGLVLTDEGFGLSLNGAEGEEPVSPADGVIRDVGVNEDGSRFVSIAADSDIEFVLSGLRSVCVERGQPVKKRVKLGEAGETLALRAYIEGRPAELSELFGLSL